MLIIIIIIIVIIIVIISLIIIVYKFTYCYYLFTLDPKGDQATSNFNNEEPIPPFVCLDDQSNIYSVSSKQT